MQQDSDLVIGVSVVQEQERLENTTQTDHLANMVTEDGTISSFVWWKFLSSAHTPRVRTFFKQV